MVDRYRLPEGFDPEQYARANPDVVLAVSQGQFNNAEDHFRQFGGGENRPGSIGVPSRFLKPIADGGISTFSETVPNPVTGVDMAGPSQIASLPTTVGIDAAAVASYMNANLDLKLDATEKGVYREDGSADSLTLAAYALNHLTSQGYKEDRPLITGEPASAQTITGQNVVLTEAEIEEEQIEENNNVQDNVNAGGETSSNPISEGPLPSWLRRPPEGAITNAAVTTYTNPETGETYTTSSGGYSVDSRLFFNDQITGGGDGLMSEELSPSDVYRRDFYASPLRTQLELNADPTKAPFQLPLGLEDTGVPFTSVETPLTPDQQLEAITTSGDPNGILSLVYREDFYNLPTAQQEIQNRKVGLENFQLPVGDTDTGAAFSVRTEPSVVSGGGSSNVVSGGGGSSNVVSGGGSSNVVAGGGMMSGSVDLNPVTNLIGTTGDTGQTTLMGRQADLASDVAGVRGVVNPLAAQVTGVGEQVTGVGEQVTGVAGQVTGVGEQLTGLGTQVGSKATDTAKATGLYEGQAGIMTGQQGLADTQANILEGQTGLAGTQAGLMSRIGDTATDTREATGLIGAVGTAGTPGTATQASTLPTGLYAGQQALGTNVTGARTELGAVGKDVSGIASSLANFENISSQERANLLSTLNTRAQELENLENMYGFQTNRLVEAQLGNTGSTGLQPGMMQPPPTDPGSLNSILAAERAAQATGQSISANLTNAANQGLVSNALGPVGTQ